MSLYSDALASGSGTGFHVSPLDRRRRSLDQSFVWGMGGMASHVFMNPHVFSSSRVCFIVFDGLARLNELDKLWYSLAPNVPLPCCSYSRCHVATCACRWSHNFVSACRSNLLVFNIFIFRSC